MSAWRPPTSADPQWTTRWWCATCGQEGRFDHWGLDGRTGIGDCQGQPFPCRGLRPLTADPAAAEAERRAREAAWATRHHAQHVAGRRAHPLCRTCAAAADRLRPPRHAR